MPICLYVKRLITTGYKKLDVRLWKLSRSGSKEQVDIKEARSRLRTLRVERNILSQVLLMIYESKELSEKEKEALLEKYKKELKEIDSNIESYSAVVELEELNEMKEQLMSLLQNKISEIDRRINELRSKVTPVEQKVTPPAEALKAEEQRTENDEQGIEELYRQVNEILKKLENIEE